MILYIKCDINVEHNNSTRNKREPPPQSNSIHRPLGTFYGPPAPTYGAPAQTQSYASPRPNYGPPRPIYGPPKPIYGPPKPIYGPPRPIYGPPKSIYGPPKPIYGPPKPVYGSPKPIYGPAKPIYGPPKPIYGPPNPIYRPPNPVYGSPTPMYGPPPSVYGPPKPIYQSPDRLAKYGPPRLYTPQSTINTAGQEASNSFYTSPKIVYNQGNYGGPNVQLSYNPSFNDPSNFISSPPEFQKPLQNLNPRNSGYLSKGYNYKQSPDYQQSYGIEEPNYQQSYYRQTIDNYKTRGFQRPPSTNYGVPVPPIYSAPGEQSYTPYSSNQRQPYFRGDYDTPDYDTNYGSKYNYNNQYEEYSPENDILISNHAIPLQYEINKATYNSPSAVTSYGTPVTHRHLQADTVLNHQNDFSKDNPPFVNNHYYNSPNNGHNFDILDLRGDDSKKVTSKHIEPRINSKFNSIVKVKKVNLSNNTDGNKQIVVENNNTHATANNTTSTVKNNSDM